MKVRSLRRRIRDASLNDFTGPPKRNVELREPAWGSRSSKRSPRLTAAVSGLKALRERKPPSFSLCPKGRTKPYDKFTGKNLSHRRRSWPASRAEQHTALAWFRRA